MAARWLWPPAFRMGRPSEGGEFTFCSRCRACVNVSVLPHALTMLVTHRGAGLAPGESLAPFSPEGAGKAAWDGVSKQPSSRRRWVCGREQPSVLWLRNCPVEKPCSEFVVWRTWKAREEPHKVSFAEYQMCPRVRSELTPIPDCQLLQFRDILRERCLHG